MRFIVSIPGLDSSKAPNLPVLEYLLDRFNRHDLEGEFLVTRTCIQGNIQIEFRGTSCGQSVVLFSQSFDDLFLTFAPFSSQLSEAVSKFLLRLKDHHAQQQPALPESLTITPLTASGLQELPETGRSRSQFDVLRPEELSSRCETTSENVPATKSAL